jgi:hypothetical protein
MQGKRVEQTGYAGHCWSDTCFHMSHDPYGPTYQLLPFMLCSSRIAIVMPRSP